MAQGIAFTLEASQAIKKSIIDYIANTVAATLAAACHHANVGYSTVYLWRKSDEQFDSEVKEALEISHQMGGDFAESKLHEAIKNGDIRAIFFYLKCRHKDRGYIEKQAITDTNKEPYSINFIDDTSTIDI